MIGRSPIKKNENPYTEPWKGGIMYQQIFEISTQSIAVIGTEIPQALGQSLFDKKVRTIEPNRSARKYIFNPDE